MIRASIVFRPHAWINTKTLKEVFGVQARIAGKRKWMHVADGRPLKTMLFRTDKARDAYLAKCRAEEIKRRKGIVTPADKRDGEME